MSLTIEAIDKEPVVVKPGDRRRDGNRPDALFVARHIDRAFAEPVVGASGLQLHFLRNRCGQAGKSRGHRDGRADTAR